MRNLKSIPNLTCDECHLKKPAYVFTGVVSDDGSSRDLCCVCYNEQYTSTRGIPSLDQAEFEPRAFSDSVGRERVFHFSVRFSTGLGICAFEWVNEGPGGYEFAVMDHPLAPVHEVFASLVRKIKDGLSVQYLRTRLMPNCEPRLLAHGEAINGRISERNSSPCVVIDGTEYSWNEFGRSLESSTGFNFRLEIFDPYDSMEVTATPEYPDPLWWLTDDVDSY